MIVTTVMAAMTTKRSRLLPPPWPAAWVETAVGLLLLRQRQRRQRCAVAEAESV
eukprot:COSAG01_NODE_39194_length_479_cov_4.118421_2_plen_53_part_01